MNYKKAHTATSVAVPQIELILKGYIVESLQIWLHLRQNIGISYLKLYHLKRFKRNIKYCHLSVENNMNLYFRTTKYELTNHIDFIFLSPICRVELDELPVLRKDSTSKLVGLGNCLPLPLCL